MKTTTSMERRGRGAKRAAVLLVLAGLVGACRSPRSAPGEPFAIEIAERNRHLEAEFRRGNMLGVSDLYADDAVLLDSNGNRLAGRQEIDAYWTRIESPREWRLEIRRVYGSEALAYELGRSHLTALHEGQVRTTTADFLLLWRRQEGGQWKIVLHAHWPVP